MMLTRLSHRPLTLATQPYKGYAKTKAERRNLKPRVVPDAISGYRIPSSYTVAVGPNTTKAQVLTALQNSMHAKLRDLNNHRDHNGPLQSIPPKPTQRSSPNATVILASKSLASWLEDTEFIHSLLTAHARRYTFLTSPDPNPHDELDADGRYLTPPHPETTVLTAAIDSIPLQTALRNRGLGNGFSTEGITVLQGNRYQLLPGLWNNARASPQNDVDVPAGLTFKLPEFKGGESGKGLEVTLPVASTVFHNGRTSTMFATRWKGESWAEYKPVQQRDVTQTSIRLTRKDRLVKGIRWAKKGDRHSLITVPLLPITRPGEIKSGLGNIIKRIEVNGEVVGASTELETVIPELLAARERNGLSALKGPLLVWALVIPAHVAMNKELMVDLHAESQAFKPASAFRPLLEAGCRVHRVLSGGGGWGDKKGLLSLDPQTKFSTTDEEDVESFARSFLGQESPSGSQGSIVTPGDWVSFFVDAETYPLRRTGAPSLRGFTEKISLCVDMPEGEVSPVPGELATVFFNYFAAASGRCLFVGPDGFRGLDTREGKGEEAGAAREMDGEDGKGSEDGKEGEDGQDGEVGEVSKGRLTFQKIDTPGTGVEVY